MIVSSLVDILTALLLSVARASNEQQAREEALMRAEERIARERARAKYAP